MAERRDGVQVLSRAALLLRELSLAPEGLTPIALADRVGLPRSTCYRIVGALCQEGFMRLAPSGKLHIGAGLISVAAAGRRELRHEAAPYLKRLSLELHETVELVVLDGEEALFTDQYVPQRSLRVVAEVGDRFPLYCTACGKAILAELPHEEAERLIPSRIEPLTQPHDRRPRARCCGRSRRRVAPASRSTTRSTRSACRRSARRWRTRAARWPRSRWPCRPPAWRVRRSASRAALLRARDDIQNAFNSG